MERKRERVGGRLADPAVGGRIPQTPSFWEAEVVLLGIGMFEVLYESCCLQTLFFSLATLTKDA